MKKILKNITIYDLRHYENRKPTDGMPEDEANRLKRMQPPSYYGFDSTAIASLLLEKIRPTHLCSSPQPRALNMLRLIASGNGWPMEIHTLKSFNDLSSDTNYDLERLKREVKKSKNSTEYHVITAGWSKKYLFQRSVSAFSELGNYIWVQDNNKAVIIIASHGAAVEMRALRMQLLAAGKPLDTHTVDMISVDDNLSGGMFDTCEGAIYHGVAVDENGIITRCKTIDQFRLPEKVKSQKEMHK